MKQDIEIRTQDGVAKAGVFRPAKGDSKIGVIHYMDAFGPRAALDEMGQRLADEGYIVLVPDLFYRFAPYGPFTGSSFSDKASGEKIMAMVTGTSQEDTKRDSAAFLDALAAAGAEGPVGVVGYCMGGGRALTAAAVYPERIAAAASFHGGGLASEAEDSPHRLAGSIKAKVYVGVAGVDRSFPPEQSARLAEALRVAEVDHVIENYVGSPHGWAVPDHTGFDQVGADRHWKRLTAFLAETLG